MRNQWLGLVMVAFFAGLIAFQHSLPMQFSAESREGSKSEQHLEEQRTYLLWSGDCRARAIEALARGSLSLPEAAAHFASVEAQRPPSLSLSYTSYPGDTVEEQLCRQVIKHVEGMLWGKPECEDVLHRLEAELTAHLEFGTLRLPNLPPGSVSPRPGATH